MYQYFSAIHFYYPNNFANEAMCYIGCGCGCGCGSVAEVIPNGHYDTFMVDCTQFMELASVLTMGIQDNGFYADLMRPHYVLHNRSKDLPICYIVTFKIII